MNSSDSLAIAQISSQKGSDESFQSSTVSFFLKIVRYERNMESVDTGVSSFSWLFSDDSFLRHSFVILILRSKLT